MDRNIIHLPEVEDPENEQLKLPVVAADQFGYVCFVFTLDECGTPCRYSRLVRDPARCVIEPTIYGLQSMKDFNFSFLFPKLTTSPVTT